MVTEPTLKTTAFIHHFNYIKVPHRATNILKIALIDRLGVTMPDVDEPVCNITCNHMNQLKTVKESSIITDGLKTSADLAARANGTISPVLDIDDSFGASAVYFSPLCLSCQLQGKFHAYSYNEIAKRRQRWTK